MTFSFGSKENNPIGSDINDDAFLVRVVTPSPAGMT
jgi:hypothetical protein